MPGKNLTRDEAAARAATVDVHAYAVELDLTGDATGDEGTYLSTTVVQFDGLTGRENGTFLDLIAPSVVEITLNGRELDPAAHFDGTRVNLPEIAADNTLRVVAHCAYMNTGEGLHRFHDPVDKGTYLYTQFEVADAKRVFACFDQPDLKATFQLTVLAPSHWEVFSNADTPAPRPVPGREGAAVWVFDATPRRSTYIAALVAGDYHVVRSEYRAGSGTVIPMAVACRRSLA